MIATDIDRHIARVLDAEMFGGGAAGIEKFFESFAARWTATSDAKGPKWVSDGGAVRRKQPPVGDTVVHKTPHAAPKPPPVAKPRTPTAATIRVFVPVSVKVRPVMSWRCVLKPLAVHGPLQLVPPS
jgi:hypothetical protein